MKRKLNKNDVLFIERKENDFLYYNIFFLSSENARKRRFYVNSGSSFYEKHRSKFEMYDLKIKKFENKITFLGINFITLLEREYKELLNNKGLLNLKETVFPLAYPVPGPIQLSFRNLNNRFNLINK